MRKSTLIAVALILTLTGVDRRGAVAATLTDTMDVVASVSSACSVGISDLDFQIYDSLVTHSVSPLDAQTTISIVCSPGRIVRVRIGQGTSPEAGSTDLSPLRQMSMGSEVLRYNLYTDAARTNVWPNAAPGVPPPGAGFPAIMNVYGRVEEGQTPSAGDYSDSVLVTVTF
jgi:spore coat protein U-like protein